jgi:hypothetical protein
MLPLKRRLFKLSYEPSSSASGVRKSGCTRLIKRVVVSMCVVLACAVALICYQDSRGRALNAEMMAFRDLGVTASRMVAEHAEGVVEGPEGPYIKSFDDFYNYVAKTHPGMVSSRNGDNPFPGLLPSGKYGRLKSVSTGSSVWIIWNERVHRRAVGEIQMRLTCDGTVLYLHEGK